MTARVTHYRIARLWSRLVKTSFDVDFWRIHLDAESYQILVTDPSHELLMDSGGSMRWRNIPITIHHTKGLTYEENALDAKRMPLLISIEYRTDHGRTCYLDEPSNAPFWTQGVLNMETA